VVLTDEVSEAERDDYLRIFSHQPCQTEAATWWWQRWRAEDATMQDVTQLEGYEEMIRKFTSGLTVEQRLAGLSPEQVLAGFAPEQRLAGLAPEQLLLGLPDAALRALPDDYLRTLPRDVQDAIRKRLGRPGA
jgi:hypothetical protein